MSGRKPQECSDMTEVRAEIDRIDAALVDLIAERFGFVDRAWQLKTNPGEAHVPWRIQQVIDKVKERAKREGPAARAHRSAVAADDRLVRPVRRGKAAPSARGQRRPGSLRWKSFPSIPPRC